MKPGSTSSKGKGYVYALSHTSGRLLKGPLDTELSLLQLIRRRVLNLELLHSLGELSLNLGLCSSLELHADLGARDGALDLVDVSLEIRLGLVTSREVLVGLLELFSILDHLVDLGAGETADRVGDAC